MPLDCDASGLIHETFIHPNWGVSGRAVDLHLHLEIGTPGRDQLACPHGPQGVAHVPLEFSTLRRVLSLMTASLMAFLFIACNQGVDADT